jgi:hypothetical protein
MSIAKSVVGPGQPNRQILVRAPFADLRAETVLTADAKQLPRQEPGLVMVDVAAQPTAFESWADLTLYFTNWNFLGSVNLRIAGMPVPAIKKA